jgi:hypothetical protein
MKPSTVILGNSLPSAQRSPDTLGPAVVASRGFGGSAPIEPDFAIVTARAAANDRTAAINPYTIRNPLWVIVIGMACFFGVVAIVIALG